MYIHAGQNTSLSKPYAIKFHYVHSFLIFDSL